MSEKDRISISKLENKEKLLTISEFRHELGIPLVFARKLVVWGLVEAYTAADGTIRITAGELDKAKELLKHPWKKFSLFIRSLGPGLVTGASDDDPSGIATYANTGSQFGFSLIWMTLWTTPVMLAIQEACARIGIVTNKGLAGVLKHHYKKSVVMLAVLLLVVANIANIGADIGAMAASLQLLTHINFILAAILFSAVVVILEIFIPYHTYVKILKWLTISIFVYILAGFIIKPDWWQVLSETVTPELRFEKEYIFAIVAFLGTTITPYLFFWQTSEEVEENKQEYGEDTVKLTPYRRNQRIAHMRTDVKTGMVLSNIVAFFIVLTTASTIFKHGPTMINSAEDAARALEPLVSGNGHLAAILFAAGIIGTGLLALPILAGSAAYALSEIMEWEEGLEKPFSKAKSFYVIIALSIIFGLALNFIGINPMVALYYAAFLNGVIAVPLMVVIMIVGNDGKVMGRETHPGWVKIFGWLGVASMAAAVVLSFWLSGK